MLWYDAQNNASECWKAFGRVLSTINAISVLSWPSRDAEENTSRPVSRTRAFDLTESSTYNSPPIFALFTGAHENDKNIALDT